MKIRAVLVVLAASVLSNASAGRTAEKTAADLLPASTVAYLEIPQPKKVLSLLLDHPLRQRVEELDQYKEALQRKEVTQLRAGILFVEFQLGMELRPALEKLTGGGIYLGVDPKTNGVALLVKADDQALLEKVRDTALKFARDNVKDSPIKEAEYRGIKAYEVGEVKLALVGSWLLVTNKGELGKQLLDNHLDGGDSLASDKQFQAARAGISGQPCAWGYVSIAPLRDAGVAKELYKDKSDNPVAEVLLGGVLSNLKQTPYATAALYLDNEQARLVASTPHDPSWVPKPREFYFGADGKGAAPPSLVAKETVLSIGTHRDMGSMWLHKSDLFDENVNAGFSQADSTLTTLFSGRDFGRDILGAFRPEMQILVARQTYQGLATSEPDIKLPAGAIIFQLKEPEKIQPQMKVLFQSLVGFLNVASAQNGQPPLDQNTEQRGEGKLISTAYLPDKSLEGRINYNFSPSIGFIGDRMIVSTTSRLAAELIDLAAADKPAPATAGQPIDNTRLNLEIPVLREILQDNRKHLVAQNQLQKGQSKEQSEKEIDGLLTLLNTVRDLSLRLGSDGKNLNLELGLRLQPVK